MNVDQEPRVQRVEGNVIGRGVALRLRDWAVEGTVEVADARGERYLLSAVGPEGELLARLDESARLSVTGTAVDRGDGRNYLVVHSVDALKNLSPSPSREPDARQRARGTAHEVLDLPGGGRGTSRVHDGSPAPRARTVGAGPEGRPRDDRSGPLSTPHRAFR